MPVRLAQTAFTIAVANSALEAAERASPNDARAWTAGANSTDGAPARWRTRTIAPCAGAPLAIAKHESGVASALAASFDDVVTAMGGLIAQEAKAKAFQERSKQRRSRATYLA